VGVLLRRTFAPFTYADVHKRKKKAHVAQGKGHGFTPNPLDEGREKKRRGKGVVKWFEKNGEHSLFVSRGRKKKRCVDRSGGVTNPHFSNLRKRKEKKKKETPLKLKGGRRGDTSLSADWERGKKEGAGGERRLHLSPLSAGGRGKKGKKGGLLVVSSSPLATSAEQTKKERKEGRQPDSVTHRGGRVITLVP